jgi:hypothetical protein
MVLRVVRHCEAAFIQQAPVTERREPPVESQPVYKLTSEARQRLCSDLTRQTITGKLSYIVG